MQVTTVSIKDEEIDLLQELTRASDDKASLLIQKYLTVKAINADLLCQALKLAAAHNRIDLIKALLDKGYPIDDGKRAQETPLQSALLGNHLETVKYLLGKVAVNGQNKLGQTALHMAVILKQPGSVYLLMQAGADVNIQDEKGLTPLHLAVMANEPIMVQALLNKGANPYLLTHDNHFSPLYYAVKEDRLKLVKLLLKRMAQTPLQEAVVAGDEAQVRHLVGTGIDINEGNGLNMPALYMAILMRHSAIVDSLLAKLAKVNIYTQETMTALHYAALSNQQTMVAKLIKAQTCNINALTGAKAPALHFAICNNNVAMAVYLLNNGANPHTELEPKVPYPHLFNAVERNQVTMVKLLLKYYVAKDALIINNKQIYYVGPVLHQAIKQHSAEHNRLALIKVLIEGGVDLEEYDINTRLPPLLYAIDANKIDIVELLLESGASINCTSDFYGKDDSRIVETALQFAVLSGSLESVKRLLAKGADVNAIQREGNTALHLASESRNFEGRLDLLRCLLKQGGDCNIKNKRGNTPLHSFIGKYAPAEIKLLLDYGAKVNVANLEGNTPLHLAAKGSFEEIVEMLLARNAAVNATNLQGNTPLHLAATYGLKKNVTLLLQYNAALDAVDNWNETVLHGAVRSGSEATVELVLQQKVAINAVNIEGKTALHLAAERGFEKIVELLLQQHAAIDVMDNRGDTALCKVIGQSDIGNADVNIFYKLFERGATITRLTPHAKAAFAKNNKSVNKTKIERLLHCPITSISALKMYEFYRLYLYTDYDAVVKHKQTGQKERLTAPLLKHLYHDFQHTQDSSAKYFFIEFIDDLLRCYKLDKSAHILMQTEFYRTLRTINISIYMKQGLFKQAQACQGADLSVITYNHRAISALKM